MIGAVIQIAVYGGIAVGGMATIAYALHEIWMGWDSPNWPTVIGTVIQSRMRYIGTRGLQGYHVRIDFQYFVNHNRHCSHRMSFGSESPMSERKAEILVRRYPEGKSVTVHYHPARHQQASLTLKINWSNLVGLIVGSLLIVLFGALMLWAYFGPQG